MDNKARIEGIGALMTLLILGGLAFVIFRGPSTPAKDASTQVACERFGSVARDISHGVLNDHEIRDGFKSIYDAAWTSNVAAIRENAQAMLATMTAGGYGAPGMLKAVNGMGKACVAAGY